MASQKVIRSVFSLCIQSLAGCLLLALSIGSLTVYGQAKAPAKATPGAPEDKVDISDLENKYWAPKDTDFSVVQNRTYTKDKKFLVSLQWGRPINDPYSEGNLFGVTANYFLSERLGIQAMYWNADMRNNNATNDLAKLSADGGARPDHGKLNSYYGIGFNLVPLYAKMSFWGQRIIYFDMAITPTIGMTKYDQQLEAGNRTKEAFTYGIDVTQYFFFSRFLALRADLKNTWHDQEVVRYRGVGAGGTLRTENVHDTLFLLGVMLFY